jgi:hypothetical protein
MAQKDSQVVSLADLGESERAMRDELQSGFVDLTGTGKVLTRCEKGNIKVSHRTTVKEPGGRTAYLRLDLFESRVEQPQEDVPSPQPLLCTRGHLSNSPLVDISDLVRVQLLSILTSCTVGVLFQSSIREPGVLNRVKDRKCQHSLWLGTLCVTGWEGTRKKGSRSY